MTTDAQRIYDEAKEKYLSLVRATKPFSRTSAQIEAIEWAYFRMDAARDWLRLAKREELDHVHA